MRAEKCVVCQAVITGAYYTLHDETYCEEHYKEQVRACKPPSQCISLAFIFNSLR
jgi:hypothetical protein